MRAVSGGSSPGCRVLAFVYGPDPVHLYHRMEVQTEDKPGVLLGTGVWEGQGEGTCSDTSAQHREEGSWIWWQVSADGCP